MTYPQDPQDPFASSTRRFDPEQPTSSYQPEQYPGTVQYGNEQYGQGYGDNGGGPDKNRRTKILIGSIVAGLVAILLVAFLISVTAGRGGETPAPAVSDTTNAPSTQDTTTSESATTESVPSSPTTAPVPAGQVVYRLLGDGDLIVVRYQTNGRSMTMATVRSPWSVTTFVPDGQASLGAIVVRGTVTCQIVVGGTVMSEGTSSGGPLNCVADLPG
ncbi:MULTISPECIES: hypothetical protein [Gordonia]|nr:hypothetical protein [Gordonia sp. UBA5067]